MILGMSVIGSLLGAVAISHYFGFLGVAANGPGSLPVAGSVDGSGGSHSASLAVGEIIIRQLKDSPVGVNGK